MRAVVEAPGSPGSVWRALAVLVSGVVDARRRAARAQAAEALRLSARGYTRMLRVARRTGAAAWAGSVELVEA